jgi:DNA-binding MarR family transcriptional regulator
MMIQQVSQGQDNISQRKDSQAEPSDHVDWVLAQWRRTRPELDTSPVAVVARLGRLVELIDGRRNALLAAHGLNRALWDVLASLRRQGAPYRLSPTDLYRELMRTSGAMTNRLAALERDRLIVRVPDPADGRSMLVELTPRGRAVVDELICAYLEVEREALRALDPDSRGRLAGMLRALLVDLEAPRGGSIRAAK